LGAKVQYSPPPDVTGLLSPAEQKEIQEIVGCLMFYAHAVDNTLLRALVSIGTQQAAPTQQTKFRVNQLLDYCATHPDAQVTYHANDMILHVESDASFQSESKARSCRVGFFYMSDVLPSSTRPPNQHDPHPTMNGPVLVRVKVMREVLSSAAKAELATVFHNAKAACPLRTALLEMGHPQPPTPIVTDNTTAVGIANDTIKQKHSRAMDLRFYWIKDRIDQGQFTVYWRDGNTNRAN